jgi:hypothetical protein
MSYVDPALVLAPRASIRSVEILYNTGDGGWSVAQVDWQEEGSFHRRLGVRWNGSENGTGIGNPQSLGNATWFILPQELERAIFDKVAELSMSGPGGLLEQYREMANDADQEAEAHEWVEGLISDASAEG